MNEHELLERLDERAASAAADLRAAAARRPIPEFDTEGVRLTRLPEQSWRRFTRPLVGIAAAVVLLAGAGGWWVAVRDDSAPDQTNTPETPTPVEPRPFVATELPDGMAMRKAFADRPADDNASPVGPGTIYGPAETEPGLVVFVVGEWSSDEEVNGLERIEVDGREAYVVKPSAGGGGTQVIVPVDGDRAVFAGGPSLSRDDLVRLATRTIVDDLRATVPDDALPDGWHPLLVEPDAGGLISPFLFGGGSVNGSGTVYYMEGGEDFTMLGSVAGDQARMFAATMFAGQVEEVTIRGHRALVMKYAETSDSRVVTVIWLEKPGELVGLSGVGLSVGEMLSIAEGVRPVSAAEFTDLVERSKLGGLDADPADTVGEGQFPDGSRWVLRQGTDGSTPSPELNVAITDDTGGSSSQSSSGSSSGSESGRGLVAVTTVEYEDRTFAAGFVTDDVVAVELRQPDGSVLGNAEVVTGAGHTGWVTELTVPATVAVALDANGNEVGRTTLTRSGNILDGRAAVTTPATEVPGS
ncbi:MAG: hypothetical protein M3508_08920 [Actinomycetota bacterium]|nr:hypothetical protein [Actinomycetota bacterium]